MENVNNSIYASANQFFSLHAYSISAIASPTRCGHIGELRRNRSEYYPDIELLPNVVTTRRCVPPLHLFPLRFVCAFNRARCNDDDDDVVGVRTKGRDGWEEEEKQNGVAAITSVCIGGHPLDGVGTRGEGERPMVGQVVRRCEYPL